MSLQVVSGSTSPEVADAWQQTIAMLLDRFSSTFAQWFSSVQFDGLAAGCLYLTARDEFVRDWVKDHFQPELIDVLESALSNRGVATNLSGSRLQVQWSVHPELSMPVCGSPLQAVHGSEASNETNMRRPRRLRIDEGRTSALATPVPGGAMGGQVVRNYGASAGASFGSGVEIEDGARSFGNGLPSTIHQGGPHASRPSSPGSFSRPPTNNATASNVAGAASSEADRVSYIAHRARRDQLNTKYTFNNFVVGPSNELAHAAAIAAAGGGGPRYNPLFICGGTGLGKTHLMHSIAHYVLDQRRDACVLYVSAERFTNQFIEALQHHKMEEFRYRYRAECDVLLVDDIQFLAGREQTQEEFFHTFNALHEADKPIVVSSDKYPQDLQRMPERLISRFASGLVADIQTPALETRVAIVRKKAQLEGIGLSDDVAVFLAQNVRSNVRELEGTLIRLAAKSSLVGRPIDLEFAQSEIAKVSPPRPDVRSVEDIQRAVCGHFRLTNADLLSKDRHKSVAFARQVAMYLCRQRLRCSFPELGRAFGNRDHTTVMSAVRRVEALKSKDPQVKAHIEAIEDRLSRSGE